MTVFYSCDPRAENLTHLDAQAAAQEYLDEIDPTEWPASLTAYAWVPEAISDQDEARWAELALDTLLDWMDDDFGHPDRATEATKEMHEAASAFVRRTVELYPIGRLRRDPARDVAVDVAALDAGKEVKP